MHVVVGADVDLVADVDGAYAQNSWEKILHGLAPAHFVCVLAHDHDGANNRAVKRLAPRANLQSAASLPTSGSGASA